MIIIDIYANLIVLSKKTEFSIVADGNIIENYLGSLEIITPQLTYNLSGDWYGYDISINLISYLKEHIHEEIVYVNLLEIAPIINETNSDILKVTKTI